jgi:hypothetical protein
MTVLESLAQLYTMQGRLSRAAGIYRQVIRSSEEGFVPMLPVTGSAHIRLGRLLYHLNDLDSARRHLLTGIERCGQFGSLDTAALGRITLGRICPARVDAPGAWQELRAAESLARGYDTGRTSSMASSGSGPEPRRASRQGRRGFHNGKQHQDRLAPLRLQSGQGSYLWANSLMN